MRLNEIGRNARYRQFWHTPYRSGNLANSVGDLSGFFNEVSYVAFNSNSVAEYGKILNEAPVIKYKTTLNGKTYEGSYTNKHYRWFDNYVEKEADMIDLENGTQRG